MKKKRTAINFCLIPPKDSKQTDPARHQNMSINIQQQNSQIINSFHTRTARHTPVGFFSGREILPSDTESTRSWNSAGTSACFQRSLSKSKLVINRKERLRKKYLVLTLLLPVMLKNNLTETKTLAQNVMSVIFMRRRCPTIASSKTEQHYVGLEISQFVHSTCHRGPETTPGNKGLYEITANEVM